MKKHVKAPTGDDELLCDGWPAKSVYLALFLAGAIVRDPHHREFAKRREQYLNMRRTLVQTSWNEIVQ